MSVFRDTLSVMSLVIIFAGSLVMFSYIFTKVPEVVNEPVRYEKRKIIRKKLTEEQIEELITIGLPLENPHQASPN